MNHEIRLTGSWLAVILNQYFAPFQLHKSHLENDSIYFEFFGIFNGKINLARINPFHCVQRRDNILFHWILKFSFWIRSYVICMLFLKRATNATFFKNENMHFHLGIYAFSLLYLKIIEFKNCDLEKVFFNKISLIRKSTRVIFYQFWHFQINLFITNVIHLRCLRLDLNMQCIKQSQVKLNRNKKRLEVLNA